MLVTNLMNVILICQPASVCFYMFFDKKWMCDYWSMWSMCDYYNKYGIPKFWIALPWTVNTYKTLQLVIWFIFTKNYAC